MRRCRISSHVAGDDTLYHATGRWDAMQWPCRLVFVSSRLRCDGDECIFASCHVYRGSLSSAPFSCPVMFGVVWCGVVVWWCGGVVVCGVVVSWCGGVVVWCGVVWSGATWSSHYVLSFSPLLRPLPLQSVTKTVPHHT